MGYDFKEKRVAEKLRDFIRKSGSRVPERAPAFPGASVEDLIRFRNNSEENCPGRACLEIQSEEESDEEGLFSVIKQPTKIFKPNGYLINITDPSIEIEPEDFGWAIRLEKAEWCLADRGDEEEPEVLPGQLYGPKDGEWGLFKDLPGFITTGASRNEDEDNFYIRALQRVQTETVQCYNGDSDTAGKLLELNSDKVLPGRLRRYKGDSAPPSFDDYAPEVWLRFMDFFDDDKAGANGPIGVQKRYYHEAIPAGYLTSGGNTKALYLALAGPQVFLAQIGTEAAKGVTPVTTKLYNKDRTDSGLTRSCIPLGSKILANKWATAKRFDDGIWYLGCWE